MRIFLKTSILQVILSVTLCCNLACAQDQLPRLFLFIGADEASSHQNELEHHCVSGAQIIYSWRQLEPQKDVYDFSQIERDLHFLTQHQKKLFFQLQDRSFQPAVFNVPDYILEDPLYHGGVAMQYDFPGEGLALNEGWVARVWDPAVRERFHLLMQKLAAEFDGKIEGVNLPETSIDLDASNLPKDFTFDAYFDAEMNNIGALRQVFHKSIVMQYINFFPAEGELANKYMSLFFSYAIDNQIGLGGPDVVPYKKAHMESSYPFFYQSKGNLLVGMAIQEPDYTYKNPNTGDYYQFSDFYHFTQDYLGANLLFWNVQQPFFSNELLPNINNQYFQCAN